MSQIHELEEALLTYMQLPVLPPYRFFGRSTLLYSTWYSCFCFIVSCFVAINFHLKQVNIKHTNSICKQFIIRVLEILLHSALIKRGCFWGLLMPIDCVDVEASSLRFIHQHHKRGHAINGSRRWSEDDAEGHLPDLYRILFRIKMIKEIALFFL